MAIRGDIKDEEKNSIVLTSFQGGMRRDVDPSELNDNEYVHGQNIHYEKRCGSFRTKR